MHEFPIIWDWLTLAMRWLHVVTAIAWIGSSFYFIALDLGLKKHDGLPQGAAGDEWQVHGGGFYHIQKYLIAPAKMPDHLTWFKWEAYSTWLSGFVLLCMVYYAGAELFLIDRTVFDVSAPVAILISVSSIALGWIVYDLLCKSPVGRSVNGLMIVLFGVLVFMSWGYVQLFSGRAALLHLGAFTATIMSANVFFIIIPNQKIVVADLIAGKSPDPALGAQAKQRSLHNNYLTLPVLFLMLSNHYPLAFATPYNWIIASLVFLMGVTIRHYFNTRHAGKGEASWTWLVTAIIFILIIWLSSAPGISNADNQTLTHHEARFASAEGFDAVRTTVAGRCSMCHAQEPFWDGITTAPGGVILDNDAAIAHNARAIYLQAGVSHAMPPGNLTHIKPEERQIIVRWYEAALVRR